MIKSEFNDNLRWHNDKLHNYCCPDVMSCYNIIILVNFYELESSPMYPEGNPIGQISYIKHQYIPIACDIVAIAVFYFQCSELEMCHIAPC